MSDDRRRNLRTQGRFSTENEGCKSFKEKRQSQSYVKEHSGKERHIERKSQNEKNSNQNPSLSYTEHSNYAFSELQERKRPKEITDVGCLVISESENGQSSILYEPDFLLPNEAAELLNLFIDTTKWNTKNIIIRGQEYPQPRLVAWYGPFPYSYSGVILEATEMPSKVKQIKECIEEYLVGKGMDVQFNSVLLNYYRNGKDSVSWHSDDELSMGICPTIASVSLGAVRKFEMRCIDHVTEEKCTYGDYIFVNLKDGSLLVMDGCMQKDWQHRVPKEFHDKPPRINLTFRTVYSLERPQLDRFCVDNISEPVARNAHELKSEDYPSPKSDRDSMYNNVDLKVPVFSHEEFPSLANNMKSKSDVAEKKININVSKSTVTSNNFPSDKSHAADYSSNYLSISFEENKDHIEQNKNTNVCKSDYYDNKEFAVSKIDMSSEENLATTYDISPRNLMNTEKNLYDDSLSYDMAPKSLTITPSSENEVPEQPKKWQPNINAVQFVPKENNSPVGCFEEEELKEGPLSLEDLLDISYSDVEDSNLRSYSHALRDEILENINKMGFSLSFRQELQFLCDITTPEQSVRNQRLISDRICKVYKNAKQRLVTRSQGSYSNYKPHKSFYNSQKHHYH